jgi:hypothetical protein
MATVYMFSFVFPYASPSVSFLFGFVVTEFTVDDTHSRHLGHSSSGQIVSYSIQRSTMDTANDYDPI